LTQIQKKTDGSAAAAGWSDVEGKAQAALDADVGVVQGVFSFSEMPWYPGPLHDAIIISVKDDKTRARDNAENRVHVSMLHPRPSLWQRLSWPSHGSPTEFKSL
jgi:hypothetical protein